MIIITVWVDELLIFSNYESTKIEIKNKLKDFFSIKDLGTVKECIGINITRNHGEIILDQK